MVGRIKGDTLIRIWKTFERRGLIARVAARLPAGLAKELQNGYIVGTEWYPMELYLGLYGALEEVLGHDEVIATAKDSVQRGLTQGTWRVFLPVLAGIAPEAFCQRTARRFEIIYKVTFEPGEARVTLVQGGANALVMGAPWSAHAGWRGGVTGGLLTIPTLAGLEGRCEAVEDPGGVRFELRWRKK
jgi:hypothetical protein